MNDYPPAEYDDWELARGPMSGTVPLRTLEQARSDLAHKSHIKRMIAARERAIAAGMRLLTEDEILEEVRKQRGAE